MTIKQIVPDEVLGQVSRRQNELFQRIRKGTIPWLWAIDRLQEIIEGRADALLTSDIQVEVGMLRSPSALLKAMKDAGHYVGGGAEALMRTQIFRESLSRRRKKFHLLFRRLGDFHLKGKVSRQKFFEIAISSGVELCSPEMGPLARLAYKHESEGEDLYVGMEPLRAINGNEPLIFHVTNNTGQGSKLNVARADTDFFIESDETWMFSRPV